MFPMIANKEIKMDKILRDLSFFTQTQIKAHAWLLAYTCPQAANHSALF